MQRLEDLKARAPHLAPDDIAWLLRVTEAAMSLARHRQECENRKLPYYLDWRPLLRALNDAPSAD